MKHLFTQLGAALIMLFALTSTVTAQTLVGMPEHGVTLSGTAMRPIINNASGKDLLGYVIEVNGEEYPELFTSHVRRNTPVQTSIDFDRLTAKPNQPNEPMAPSRGTPTKLNAVIFADGEYVARTPQDADEFQFLAISMEAEKGLGSMLTAVRHNPAQQAAVWAKIYALSAVPTQAETESPEGGFKRGTQHIVARDIIATKQNHGDDAAFDMADRIAKLPSVWRKAQ